MADLTGMGSSFGLTAALSAVEGEIEDFVRSGVEGDLRRLPVEPFLSGRPLVPAQWPNRLDPDQAWAANLTDFVWTRVDGAPEGKAKKLSHSGPFRKWRFPFVDGCPFDNWADWDDVVAHGFWTVDWSELVYHSYIGR